MFSETRYALNGDLRVAYRASAEGPRDIVFVSNWFFCCEALPELPSLQGWVEAMTSLGRLIFLDQPGTGVSDPVTPGAMQILCAPMNSTRRNSSPGWSPLGARGSFNMRQIRTCHGTRRSERCGRDMI